MPYRRRRGTRRRRRRRRFTNHVLPLQKAISFKYCEHYDFTATVAGQGVIKKFNCNSPYDPYFGIGGNQPRGWDQMGQLYDKYHVISSKITLSFPCMDTSDIDCIIGITKTNGLDPLSDSLTANDVLDARFTRYQYINKSGASNGKLSMTFSAKKWFGQDDIVGDPHKGATWSANPHERALFNVFVLPLNPTDTFADYDVIVQIEYNVICSRPVFLQQS